MIPFILEKAIQKGMATYSKYTHAFSMFGTIPVPNDSVVIIVDIKWHQFLNPYKNAGNVTVAEFFKFNEYQLKIDGYMSTNVLTYRNGWDITKITTANPGFDATIDTDMNYFYTHLGGAFLCQPKQPIIQDVYFICQKFINITISRNAFLNSFATTYGPLNNRAGQQSPPNGVKGVNLGRRYTMSTAAPVDSMVYTPPGNTNAGLDDVSRNRQSYSSDIQSGVNSFSQIYPPDSGFCSTINNPSLTQPLVEFGIVTINKNFFDQLMDAL